MTFFVLINVKIVGILTLWHSERPKLHTVLAFLSAIGVTFMSTKNNILGLSEP